MDLKKLLGLRPTEATSANIRDAIARAEQGQVAALDRVRELEAGRGTLLLSGDARAVEAGERELTEARMEAERCGVMAKALHPSLTEAQTREKAAEILALHARAEREGDEFARWWRDKYPLLAAEIHEALMKERSANEVIAQMMTLANTHRTAWEASGVTVPASPAARAIPGSHDATIHCGRGFRLPTTNCDGDRAIWPTYFGG